MTNQLQSLSRDLDQWFSGKGNRGARYHAKRYGFRVGSNVTPIDKAQWHGPYDTREAAKEAAQAYEVACPMHDPSDPYPWAIEVWPD